MERDGERKRLMGQRAELVQRNVGRLDTIEVKLRLAYLDQEINKKKPGDMPSLFAKTRSVIGRLLPSS